VTDTSAVGNTPKQDFDPTGLSPEEIALLNGGENEEAADEDSGEVVSEETTGPGEDTAEEEESPSSGKPPKGFVPHAALHQTRLELKEAKEQLQRFQEFQRDIATKLAEARAQAQQPQQQEAPQPEEIPDENEDPMALLAWAKKELLARKEQEQRQQQMSEQERRIQEFSADVAREFDTQAAADPDAQESFQFLQAALQHEWKTVHAPLRKISFEDFQRKMILDHSAYARQNRIPIANYVKNLAAARGWSPGLLKKLQEQQQQAPADDGALEKQIAQVEKVAKAQSTNVSLGKSSSGDSELTLASLAKMSGAELEKLAEKNPALFEKLTGIK
jgi:hypothetical protein